MPTEIDVLTQRADDNDRRVLRVENELDIQGRSIAAIVQALHDVAMQTRKPDAMKVVERLKDKLTRIGTALGG